MPEDSDQEIRQKNSSKTLVGQLIEHYNHVFNNNIHVDYDDGDDGNYGDDDAIQIRSVTRNYQYSTS